MNLDTYQPRDPAANAANHYAGHQGDVWHATYSTAFRECMAGSPKVFATTMAEGRTYDNEQDYQFFAELGRILQVPGQSAEQIGERVLKAVAEVAHNYAVLAADEAAERARWTDDGDVVED